MHIRVDGPARLYAGAMDCDWTGKFEDMSELGITENGVQISLNQLTHRVNSDDMGGAEGNPADILVMGTTATIRGVITKYPNDQWMLGQIFNGLYGVAEGWTVLPGSPLFAGGGGFSLAVIGYTTYFYFPKCEMVTQPREFNISTTERKTSFAIQAQPIHDTWGSAIYETGPFSFSAPPYHCANSTKGYYGHGGSVAAQYSANGSYAAITSQNYTTATNTQTYNTSNASWNTSTGSRTSFVSRSKFTSLGGSFASTGTTTPPQTT